MYVVKYIGRNPFQIELKILNNGLGISESIINESNFKILINFDFEERSKALPSCSQWSDNFYINELFKKSRETCFQLKGVVKPFIFVQKDYVVGFTVINRVFFCITIIIFIVFVVYSYNYIKN